MVPKKKRRRRKTIADSGLGVSLQEKDAELMQEEACVADGNLHEESELGENDEHLSQAENSSVAKEKGPLDTEQGSLGENYFPEIPGDFPEKSAESPREANVSSQETKSPPNKAMQILETEALNACTSDSDSHKTMRELLQTVNVTSQVSDKGSESELPVCTACAEGSNNSNAGSSVTEIFVWTSKEPRSSTTSQLPLTDENFSMSKICASQKTGQCVAEDEGNKEVITQKIHDTPPIGQSLLDDIYSCPADFGIQRQIPEADRQRLPNHALSSFGKKLPFRNNFNFQRHYPYFRGSNFSRGGAVIRESPQFVEQQNTGRQNERVEGSTQNLSVWSEAQSVYFPRGKPSDLGELLEVAARYVVKAWLKGMHPPISGSPTNLVIKFCGDCHKKYCYDENESNHLCSKRVGGFQNSLKLRFYVELELCDETQETLKVALTGDEAVKLFGCRPQEFLGNEEFQKRVWDCFKHLLKGGNRPNLCLKDEANFSLEPHLNGRKMNYRVLDIRPFSSRTR